MTKLLLISGLLLMGGLLLAGCTGEAARVEGIFGSGSPGPEDSKKEPTPDTLRCEAPTPGVAPMRRLSHIEYRYVVEDLFNSPTLGRTAVVGLVNDPVSLGFSNSATLLDVKPVLGQQYMEAAEKVAETSVSNLTSLGITCGVTPADPQACATAFIRGFVRKAYRRPLTPTEEQGYLTRFNTLRTAYDFKTGIEWIISTALQSPQFLYRAEIDDAADPAVRPVNPFELASRLSFFLWHSLPDDALLAAATENKLNTREDVEREARRMLADPRAARMLNFFEEWLDVDKLGAYPREASAFPALPAGLPDLFKNETRAFVKHVVFDGDGKLETLLTANYTFANATLATHYGLAATGSGANFVQVALPAGRRGVWMQGGPLTSHDKPHRTSIVNRGLRIRTALLCQNIPAPPDNVNLTLGPVDQTASQRDRLAAHRTNVSCSGCHSLMDPVGQIFENVDAVGRIRTTDEAGRAVTTDGEVNATKEANGAVADGNELMTKLAQSSDVRQCFATQMFRYVHGREEQPTDACSRQQAFEKFAAAGYNVQELAVGIVTSDDFMFRPSVAVSP